MTKKAVQASSFNGADELAGELAFFVIPYPGTALSDFEKEMRQVLEEFEQSGVTDADITKFKANRESNFINGLASVSGKVSQLASYQTYLSNPNGIKNDLKRYQNITKADVMRVYNQYVKGKPAVIQSVLPEDGTAPAQADNYTPPTSRK